MSMQARTILLSLCCLVLPPAAAQAQAPDAAMKKLADDYTAAFAKKDAKAIAMLFDENAIVMNPEGQVLVGRAAIERSYREDFAAQWKAPGVTIEIMEGTSQMIAPNVWAGEGSWVVKDPSMAGHDMPGMKGRYANTLVMKDGKLLIAVNAAQIPFTPPSM